MIEKNHEENEIHLDIDGTLDLHTFRPSEIGSLLPEYFIECRKKGIYDLRIIHGKGTGALRKSVHSILKRDQNVHGFTLANEGAGGWGATLVRLKQRKT